MTLAGIILAISIVLPLAGAPAPPVLGSAPSAMQEPASSPAPAPAPQGDSVKPSRPVEPDEDKKPVQNEPTVKPPATGAPDQPSPDAAGASQQDQKVEPATPPSPPAAAPDKTSEKKSTKTRPMKRRVVRNGSTTDPQVQISPGLSPEQASTQTQSTTQLLAATEGNLKKLSGRSLSAAQQQMLEQVRRYADQARTAMDAGDLQRAHTLAFKARLLSDELALR